jgi:outer membrane immunogenic protein
VKSITLATALVVGIIGHAAAADVAEEVVIVDEGFNWSGVYVGAHAGYGWGDVDASYDDPFDLFPPGQGEADYTADGGLLGVQAGYNWQVSSLVLGVEADVSYLNLDETVDAGFDEGTYGVNTYSTEIDWLATVRGRVGYAMNRTLLFATAGAAFADVRHIYAQESFSYRAEVDETAAGYVLGAGIEHAFTDNVSVQLQYQFVDFGDETIDYGDTTSTNFDIQLHLLKLGINYHF